MPEPVGTVVSSPFNNPGAQPALVEMWRNNLRKSQGRPEPAPVLPATITFGFDGVGTAPDTDMVSMGEVSFPCRIIGCRLYAGNPAAAPAAATATVDLRVGQQGAWASGTRALYGSTMPSLSGAEASVSITGWLFDDLQPGDLLVARLATFSTTGGATWVVLSLLVRRLDIPNLGVATVIDGGTDTLITAAGDAVIQRR